MSETRDFVAERIMGFERGWCQGTVGWGNVNTDSSGKSGFWCDWCGQRIDYNNLGPCPKYPFPKFTLVDLMRRLGEEGCIPTMVRFDVLRKERRFTIADSEGRVCDTDNPLEDYCAYLTKKYGEGESRG